MSETPAEIIARQLEADDDKCIRSYDIGAHRIIDALAAQGWEIVSSADKESLRRYRLVMGELVKEGIVT